jgi:hypothetical protein
MARAARSARQTLHQVLADRTRRFDKGGDQFYDQISALHKSCAAPIRMPRCTGWRGCWTAVRSGLPGATLDPDGGGGHRPGRSARMQMAIEAWDAYDRLGSARGRTRTGAAGDLPGQHRQVQRRPIARGTPPSAMSMHGTQDVPLHLRNAPTKLMKSAGLRQGLPVRPRCRRRHRAGPDRLPGCDGRARVLRSRSARHGRQAQGKARCLARCAPAGASFLLVDGVGPERIADETAGVVDAEQAGIQPI